MGKRDVKVKIRHPDGKESWEDLRMSASGIRQLKRWIKEGVELIGVRGKNERVVRAIESYIKDYQEKGRVDPLRGVRDGAGILGQSTKETAQKLRQRLGEGIAGRILRRGKKDEGEKGSSDNDV